MFSALTVRQSLSFTARLRLPRSWSTAKKLQRVDELIDCLNLAKCADTTIESVSGGERKRLCIASECIVQPKLLLLDEPTSGLDSTTAVHVARLLRDLTAPPMTATAAAAAAPASSGGDAVTAAAAAAVTVGSASNGTSDDGDDHDDASNAPELDTAVETNSSSPDCKIGSSGSSSTNAVEESAAVTVAPSRRRRSTRSGFIQRKRSLRVSGFQGDVSIACTIHQPSSQIFGLFDDLIFVDDGNVVFFGPCSQLLPTLSSVGLVAPPNYNPSDFMMDVVSLGEVEEDVVARLVAIHKERVAQKAQGWGQSSSSSPSSPSETPVEVVVVRNEPAGTSSSSSSSSSSPSLAVAAANAGHGADIDAHGGSGNVLTIDATIDARLWEPTGCLEQVWILSERAMLVAWPTVGTWSNFWLYLVQTLLAGILWLPQRDRFDEGALFSRMSFVFWVVGTWTFFALFGCLMLFESQLRILRKELSVSSYSLFAYFTAVTAVIVPLDCFWTLLFVPVACVVVWCRHRRHHRRRCRRRCPSLLCLSLCLAVCLSVALSRPHLSVLSSLSPSLLPSLHTSLPLTHHRRWLRLVLTC